MVSANVASDDDCRRMARAAQDRWGRIDYLVNNAGTTKFVAANRLDGLSAHAFHDLYSVHTLGLFQQVRHCHAALPSHDGPLTPCLAPAALDRTWQTLRPCPSTTST